jgi:hypothetical protein
MWCTFISPEGRSKLNRNKGTKKTQHKEGRGGGEEEEEGEKEGERKTTA